MSLITSITDSTLSLIGEGIATRMFRPLGDVVSFSFSSEKKEVAIGIKLTGDREVTEIRLGRYYVTEADGVLKIRFNEIVTTTAWLTEVGEKFFRGRTMDVPPELAIEVKAIFGEPEES
jgi:hypothetical protein